MTPKTIAVLAVATAAVVGAAVFATGKDTTTDAAATDGKLFPGLLDQVNAVQAVTIDHAGGTLTLQRGEHAWGLAERHGYPVRADRVRALVLALANLQIAEAKTANPANHAVLHLRDPGAEGAKSKRISLLDGGGKTLAAVILGKEKFAAGGSRGVYVRRASEDQTWLARGTGGAGTEPRGWLEREVLDVDMARVARVKMRHPDGETWIAERKEEEGSSLTVTGQELKSKTALDELQRVLKGLKLEDVRKAEGLDMSDSVAGVVTVSTFDGLTVEARILPGTKDWLVLKATGEGDAAKEAEEINARTADWAFAAPAFKSSALQIRLEEVVKKEEEPVAENPHVPAPPTGE